ncbi:MAG: transposase, partial [Desulfobacterales bacterium]|nr:transposase [Desulfobacterales bacterium]
MKMSPVGLEVISDILDDNPDVLDCVFADLAGSQRNDTGRKGLNAEQVLRICVLKQYRSLSYNELAFHLEDSQVFRAFSRLDMGQYPCSSTLQENIKSISESSWEKIHNCIVLYAQKEGFESGRKIRIDSTAIDTDIHDPTDATLLFDGIRVISRWLNDGYKLSPQPDYKYSNHTRVGKRRLMSIINAKNSDTRVAAYHDLVDYSIKAVDYAVSAIPVLESYQNDSLIDILTAGHLAGQLERVVGLMGKVINQTERRVFNEEKVPSSEKIISL